MFLHDYRLCGWNILSSSQICLCLFLPPLVSSGTFSHGRSYSPKFSVFSHQLFNLILHLKKLSYDSIPPFFFFLYKPAIGMVYACVLSRFSRVQLFATLWTRQASVPIGFSRQEYWSGAMPSSRGSFCLREQICVSVSCVSRSVLYHQHHLGSPEEQSIPSHISSLSFVSSLYSTSSYQVFFITSN